MRKRSKKTNAEVYAFKAAKASERAIAAVMKERTKAFVAFCHSQRDCGSCPLWGDQGIVVLNDCEDKWLESDTDI